MCGRISCVFSIFFSAMRYALFSSVIQIIFYNILGQISEIWQSDQQGFPLQRPEGWWQRCGVPGFTVQLLTHIHLICGSFSTSLGALRVGSEVDKSFSLGFQKISPSCSHSVVFWSAQSSEFWFSVWPISSWSFPPWPVCVPFSYNQWSLVPRSCSRRLLPPTRVAAARDLHLLSILLSSLGIFCTSCVLQKLCASPYSYSRGRSHENLVYLSARSCNVEAHRADRE